ncbi:alcohol dehydrogenase catalytic domain-containing protein [Microbacterium karelineae]|uniref:alcohol dehydrogenase catalytic domain-containing protein n=1 Tax=Microbacterium karelineae TaxID=2654283 RepID=UPI0012EA2470|nr:zinc-binding dehydrogenase [Microbacterium karelineae]
MNTTAITTTDRVASLVSERGEGAPRLVTIGTPTPGPGEVLVSVAAAAINPVDRMVASPARTLFGIDDDAGLGWDVSGIVSAVGEGSSRFTVGDRVAGMHPGLTETSRTHAEAVVMEEGWLARVPTGLDLVEVASVPLNALTAQQAVGLLGAGGGRSLLITGAAGAVGGYAVQFASEASWRVTALARPGDEDFVTAAGADRLVSDVAPMSYDAVLDAAALRERALAGVRDGGTYVGVLPAMPLAGARRIRALDVMVSPDSDALAGILDRAASGDLPVRVAGRTPLSDAPAAYARSGESGQRGRWLLLGPAAR